MDQVQPIQEGAEVKNSSNAAKNKKIFLFGLGGFLLVALVAVIITGVYRVYFAVASDRFTVTVARVLRLPALKVNGDVVLYPDFVQDLAAIKTMKVYDEKNGGGSASQLTADDMTDQVLWRFANNILAEQAAASYGLKLDETKVKETTTQLAGQFKDTASLNAALKERYGWGMDTYTEKVIKPYVLQSQLAVKIQEDQKLIAEKQAKTKQAAAEIKAGAKFDDVVAKYTEDTRTKSEKGVIDFFPKDSPLAQYLPEVVDTAFITKPGEVSDVIDGQYGFVNGQQMAYMPAQYIVKVLERKTVPTKDAKGKTTNVEQAKVQILVVLMPNLGSYLDEAALKGNYHLYLKVHNPFVDLTKATTAK